MQTVASIDELRHWIGRYHRDELGIALVPTMGALHEGHLRLVDEAARRGDRVVVSVFVNPMQFGPSEDFEAYPRDLDADARRLAERGAHLLFAPAAEVVYPRGLQETTRVEVPGLSDILCGAARPGHFRGVATVVAKLFNLVQPAAAVFGEKDYQQLIVLRRMAEDLNFPVEIVGVPTVREADGLAMSSRNAYLSARGRALAPRLYETLQWLAGQVQASGDGVEELERDALQRLRDAGLEPEYVSVRCAADLAPVGPTDRALVALAAARVEGARLIDNLPFTRASAGGK